MDKRNVLDLGDLQRQKVDVPVLTFSTTCYMADLSMSLDEIYSLHFERYHTDLEVKLPSIGKEPPRVESLPMMHYDDLSSKIHYLLFDLSKLHLTIDNGFFSVDKMLVLDGYNHLDMAWTIYTDLTTMQPKPIKPGDFRAKHREDFRQMLVRQAVISADCYDFVHPSSEQNTTMLALSDRQRSKQAKMYETMRSFVLNCLRAVDDAFIQQEDENENNIREVVW
ncbi:MAG: hypothetical protein Q4D03_01785 [Bacteroidales bacterium]|nr:hypothetical protein [Bacteroidales bacterium]